MNEGHSISAPINVTTRRQTLPHGWRWTKLCELARLESGHTPSRERLDWWGGDISWLSLTEIRGFDGKWVGETELRTNEKGIANSAARVLPKGTVCLSRTASVGFVAIMGQPMSTSQDFANWVCGKDIDPEFLMYSIIASRSYLRSIATGATHKTIYMPALKSFHVCHPSINVQKKIAVSLKAQIAEVNQAQRAVQQQLSDTDILRRVVLKRAFEEFESTQKKVLGDHAICTSGSTPPRGNKLYWAPSEIPWVKTGEVVFEPITKTEESVSKAALSECSLTLLPPDTVLIAMYGQGKTRGQSAVLKIPATTNQACFAILPNDIWEPGFLFLWLKSSYNDLRALSEDRGGNQANLNGSLLKALLIPAPERAVQRAVVKRIEKEIAEVDLIERAKQSRLKDISDLPIRLLAHAFKM